MSQPAGLLLQPAKVFLLFLLFHLSLAQALSGANGELLGVPTFHAPVLVVAVRAVQPARVRCVARDEERPHCRSELGFAGGADDRVIRAQ